MASERANPSEKLEFFEVGVCETAFEIGFLIGKRFSNLIKKRISSDPILQEQLLPFARTIQSKSLLDELCNNNKQKFPRYWDELVGTFVQKSGRAATKEEEEEEASNDCSDVLIVNDSMAIVDVKLLGEGYVVKWIVIYCFHLCWRAPKLCIWLMKS